MKPELKSVLERVGWDSLYEKFIPGLAPPNARAERRACSPFPDTIDREPSFSINVITGLWNCFKTERGGDYITFRAILDAEDFDTENGLAIYDYGKTERKLIKEFGISKGVDEKWVQACADLLFNDLSLQHLVTSRKPWNVHLLHQLKVGYSMEHHRIVIPVYDHKGELINCRMYRPGSEPKFIWLESNLGGNFLYPRIAWKEQSLILVEGETDVLSLRSVGFPAVSGTIGASGPVPDGIWWRRKHVYVLMDSDQKGQEAEVEACRRLREEAANVMVVKLPQWEGMPEKADISDYIMYLNVLGYEIGQQQRAITELLKNAVPVEMPHHVYDKEALVTSFREAIGSQHLGQRVKFVSRITAKSTNKFILPTVYSITCPAQGHTYCKICPMNKEFHGNARFLHDPRSRDTLRLIQVTEEKQIEAYKDIHGIPQQCPDPKSKTLQAIDVEAIILNASASSGVAEEESSPERQRREAYIVNTGQTIIEENTEYIMEGFMYPHPKTQHAVFLIDKVVPSVDIYNSFMQSAEYIEQLRQFSISPGQPVIAKLVDVSKDMADSVTYIYGRPDLHLAYRTVFHSVIAFNFMGKPVNRGWIEALVLGDTRCGKSDAFKKMSEFFGMGLLIDCKMQSVPGILGTVLQSMTGEYYAVAGMLPQQDRRLVCFDEFVVPKWSGQSLIEILSSTRSEGIVRISKAASAEFKARVRSIWLANPAAGRLISQCADSGVELIHRIISQPEDIARFDMALTVSQFDVPPEIINQVQTPPPSRYRKDIARTLLAWVYSRKPEQIYFTKEAEEEVIHLSLKMCNKYDGTIPLVEVADQRTRIAKIAVSVAAQVFSTDETGEYIIVTLDHVKCVEQLFTLWYDKPAMGYDRYSVKIKSQNTLQNESAIRDLFDKTVVPHGKRLAEELLRLDEFSERAFGTIIPVEGIFVRTFLQQLYFNRAVCLTHRGKKDSYEKTPAFTNWLKQYMSEGTIEIPM